MQKKLFDKHLKDLTSKGVNRFVGEVKESPKDEQISDGIKDLFK